MSSREDGPNLDAAQFWQESLDTDELIQRALSRYFRAAGGIGGDRTDTGLAEEALIAAHEIDALRSRVEYLEQTVDRLETRLDAQSTDTKTGKVASIVQYALNKGSKGQDVVKLTPQEVKGAAGVSRRYAYDLVDELPEEYDWLLTPDEMVQYGEVELVNDEKRLGVDFEGVHSAGCPVNKFTTGPSETTATDGEEG